MQLSTLRSLAIIGALVTSAAGFNAIAEPLKTIFNYQNSMVLEDIDSSKRGQVIVSPAATATYSSLGIRNSSQSNELTLDTER